MMGNEQQLGSLAHEARDHLPHQVTVEGIQSLQGFVQDEQRRMFDQGTGDQHQSLLTERERVERLRP